jgi:hypothetical protein
MTSSCYASQEREQLPSNALQNNDLAILIVYLIETYVYGLSTGRNIIQFQREGRVEGRSGVVHLEYLFNMKA